MRGPKKQFNKAIQNNPRTTPLIRASLPSWGAGLCIENPPAPKVPRRDSLGANNPLFTLQLQLGAAMFARDRLPKVDSPLWLLSLHIGTTSCQCTVSIRRGRNIGSAGSTLASKAPTSAHLAPASVKEVRATKFSMLNSTCVQTCPSCAMLGPSWAQVGPKLEPTGPSLAQVTPKLGPSGLLNRSIWGPCQVLIIVTKPLMKNMAIGWLGALVRVTNLKF